jgi:hypothetical protein
VDTRQAVRVALRWSVVLIFVIWLGLCLFVAYAVARYIDVRGTGFVGFTGIGFAALNFVFWAVSVRYVHRIGVDRATTTYRGSLPMLRGMLLMGWVAVAGGVLMRMLTGETLEEALFATRSPIAVFFLGSVWTAVCWRRWNARAEAESAAP